MHEYVQLYPFGNVVVQVFSRITGQHSLNFSFQYKCLECLMFRLVLRVSRITNFPHYRLFIGKVLQRKVFQMLIRGVYRSASIISLQVNQIAKLLT